MVDRRRRERSVVKIINLFVLLCVIRECEIGDRGFEDGEWRGCEVVFIVDVVVCSMVVVVFIVMAPICIWFCKSFIVDISSWFNQLDGLLFIC